MKGILFHIPCADKCSYKVIFDVIAGKLKYMSVPVIMGLGHVNVTETVFFFKTFRHYRDRRVLILPDTKFVLPDDIVDFPNSLIFTTSKWNADELAKRGVHVDGILPRPVNDEMVSKYAFNNEKKYDFVTIASTDTESDHKNVLLTHKVLSEMGLRKRSVIVSNVKGVSDYNVFSLTEEEKYRLLSQSRFYLALSRTEGFGMPVAEANALGVPVVYVNAHAFAEYAIGIPVDVAEYQIRNAYGKLKYVSAEVDVNDLKRKIRYALSLSETEYEDISKKAYENALRFSSRYIAEKINTLLDEILKH